MSRAYFTTGSPGTTVYLIDERRLPQPTSRAKKAPPRLNPGVRPSPSPGRGSPQKTGAPSPTRQRGQKKPRPASTLGCDPAHHRDGADRVLRAALDDAVAVGHVHEHVALAIIEPHDVQLLEHEAAVLVE